MSSNKSFSTETSERYSRALFEVTKEFNELDKTESDIKNFQSLIKISPEVKNFLKDPTQSIDQQNKAINLLAEKLNFSKNLKNFFLLLIEKRRIFFVEKISLSDIVNNLSSLVYPVNNKFRCPSFFSSSKRAADSTALILILLLVSL